MTSQKWHLEPGVEGSVKFSDHSRTMLEEPRPQAHPSRYQNSQKQRYLETLLQDRGLKLSATTAETAIYKLHTYLYFGGLINYMTFTQTTDSISGDIILIRLSTYSTPFPAPVGTCVGGGQLIYI